MASGTTTDTPIDAEHAGGVEPGDSGVSSTIPTEVANAAASPQAAKTMSEEDKLDALTWLLSDDDEIQPVTQVWTINVGTDEQPKKIDWTIKPVDGDTMNRLRAQARAMGGGGRQRRGRGAQSAEADFDVTQFNLRLLAVATVYPDLVQVAEQRGAAAADPLLGPVTILQHQFRNKPGLIDQLAGYVMLLSGYDEDDVVRPTPEITLARAAGNS